MQDLRSRGSSGGESDEVQVVEDASSGEDVDVVVMARDAQDPRMKSRREE